MKERVENKQRGISLGAVIKKFRSEGLTGSQRELMTLLERVGRQYGLHFSVGHIYQFIEEIFREKPDGKIDTDKLFNFLVENQGQGSTHNSETWLSQKATLAEGKMIKGRHCKRGKHLR